MHIKFSKQFIFLLTCLFIVQLNSPCFSEECNQAIMECNHLLYAGPEIYHVQRTRSNGTCQKGWVYGARIGYDRIKRFSIYWGADALYAEGRLSGKSAQGAPLKSNFRDANIEGRLGYTFQQKCGRRMFITPYLGGGYAEEINNSVDPSPLKTHMRIYYPYVCAGFFSGLNLTCHWLFGINFKAKYSIDTKNKVTHDPEEYDVTMKVKNEMQYRIEAPVYYQWCGRYAAGFVPFYEYRHYGGQVNFPFDFLETKLNIYGATFKFVYNL